VIASARLMLKRFVLTVLPEPALQPIRRGYYARMLRRGEEDPEPDLPLLAEFVHVGDCVADIGANVGVFTKPLSRFVGREGLVYAVEPIAVTFDVLCSNVRKLGLVNVRPLNYAISDRDGSAVMEVPLRPTGWEDFYRARVVTDEGARRRGCVRVDRRTIDSLWADSDRPLSFIKCDVEGHELDCLRGARRVLARWAPAWLLEVTGDPDRPDSAAHAAFELLAGRGYRAFWFDGERLHRRRPGEISINYWFLTPEHFDRLGPERAVEGEAEDGSFP
jgi:FkbM family methyltransferase